MDLNKSYLIMVKNKPNKFQQLIHHNHGWNLPWHYYIQIHNLVAPSVRVTYPLDLVENNESESFFTKSKANQIAKDAEQDFDIVVVVSVGKIIKNLESANN